VQIIIIIHHKYLFSIKIKKRGKKMKKIPSIIVALLFIFTAFSAFLIVPNSNACSYWDRETTKKEYCFHVAFEDLQDNSHGEENWND
jgi:hypothetical protein